MAMPKDAEDRSLFREEINQLDRNDAANDEFLALLEKHHPEQMVLPPRPTDVHPTAIRTVRAYTHVYLRSSANYES